MIYVLRNEGDSATKVVSMFMKRSKKANVVARARKTKYFAKPLSHLKKKTKAINTAKYLENQKTVF
jgi:ribosomal protein S21